MSEISIDLRGIAETSRALASVGRGVRVQLNAGLVEIAGKAAARAQAIAEQKGLRQSGALIEGIKAGVRSNGAVIRETAVRTTGKGAPYKYPGIWEYGGRSGFGTVGPRAFLRPAVDEENADSVREVSALLDRLIHTEGF